MVCRTFSLTVLTLSLFTTESRADLLRVLVPSSTYNEVKSVSDTHPDLELIPYSSGEEILQHIGECDGFIGSPDEALLQQAPKLRWVQIPTAGVEHVVDLPSIKESDIVMTNCKIVMGPQLADHAMALLLALTRNMRFYVKGMESAQWDRQSGLPLMELHGKTMLVLGLGGAGAQLAERAHAFGMRVIAVDPKDIPMMNAVEYVGKPDELLTLLPQSDVIASCVPLTNATRKMLGPEEFAAAKDGVIVINVSRGGVIDTDALVAALQLGKVGAAGLDVTDPEPLPPDHPLWSMPNVVITPHIAGFSEGRTTRCNELFRDNITRFVEGLPLINVVDKNKEY